MESPRSWRLHRKYGWQLYGQYVSGQLFATAVRASNAYMAQEEARKRMLADGVFTYCKPITLP